jgi:RNA polymerase sigma-70 factor (ECF subfamily)
MITEAIEDKNYAAAASGPFAPSIDNGVRENHAEKQCDWQYLASQLYDELRLGLHLYLRGLGLLPLDAEDVAQETFFRLVRQLRTGTSVENIRAWVYHVAYNVSMDIHRSKRKIAPADEAPSWRQEAADCRSNPEWLYIKREEVRRVRLALSQLTPRQLRSVQLRANGCRYRDIAADLCVSEQRAIHLVKRALTRLSSSC